MIRIGVLLLLHYSLKFNWPAHSGLLPEMPVPKAAVEVREKCTETQALHNDTFLQRKGKGSRKISLWSV